MVRGIIATLLILIGIGMLFYSFFLLNENFYKVAAGKSTDSIVFIFLLFGFVMTIVGIFLYLIASYKNPQNIQIRPKKFKASFYF